MDRKVALMELANRCAEFLRDRYGVKRVILIGSLAYGLFHEKSDIDLVVDGLPQDSYIKSLTELYDLLPAGVDINLIPFEDAFDSLKRKVQQKGKILYESGV